MNIDVFLSFLLQANEDYLNFNGPFDLKFGPNATETTLLAGTRNTIVIVQDGAVPKSIEVSALVQIKL